MMKKWAYVTLIVLTVMAVVGFGGYLVAGYTIYTTLASVNNKCNGEIFNDSTPADFVPVYEDSKPDATPYLMADFQEIEFSARDSSDDITIQAFFVPAESQEVIIIVHGINSCRRDPVVLLPAGMLSNNNYNVLMLDVRNHGDSEVINGLTTIGNNEWRDVAGAYDWLIEQGFESKNIGLVGISLGGATSINAFAEEQGISALWVDSTFADIKAVISAELARNNYPVFLTGATLLVARISGVNLTERSPLESIKLNNNRPIFITHGTADARLSVDYATDLYNVSGTNAGIKIFDGTDHVEAVFRYPDEYNESLNTFFDAALRSDSTQ